MNTVNTKPLGAATNNIMSGGFLGDGRRRLLAPRWCRGALIGHFSFSFLSFSSACHRRQQLKQAFCSLHCLQPGKAGDKPPLPAFVDLE